MSSLQQFEQKEYEKMMLNDVVSEIKQVVVTDDNFNDSTKISIKLENCFIKQLQEADDPDHKCSIILHQYYQKIETKPLTYKGRTKIRKDVLKKLIEISNSLKRNENISQIKRRDIQNCIKNVLGEVVPRVVICYFKSVNEHIPYSNYDYVDIRPYIRAVEKAQHHSTSSFDIT